MHIYLRGGMGGFGRALVRPLQHQVCISTLQWFAGFICYLCFRQDTSAVGTDDVRGSSLPDPFVALLFK